MITLAEESKLQQGKLEGPVIRQMIKAAPFIRRVPFDTIGTFSQKYVRWSTLSTVGYRRINAAWTENTGTFESFSETVAILGGTMDMDRQFIDDSAAIANMRAEQLAMKTDALARQYATDFIGGDVSVTAAGIDGLKVRVTELPSAQTIDAASLDLSTGVARSTNAQALVDLLHQLCYTVERVCGKPDMIIMNDTTYLYVSSTLRRSGLLKDDSDAYGLRFDSFRGVEIVDAGYTDDGTTKVIADNHDGSTGITSMYAVKFGPMALRGIQKHALKVEDLGRLDDGVTYRTLLEWPHGLVMKSKYCAARLKGLKIA